MCTTLFQRHDDATSQYSLSTLLPLNQVHVWHASLDVKQSELDRLETVLSRDERDRASRFHFLRDRRRFAAGRGILRQILAYYLSQEPRALRFGYGRCGKPYLKSSFGVNELRFNLAHSHGVALCGIVRNREIGVDLERIDRAFEVQQIAEHFFSRRECSQLSALPSRLQLQGFFNCWTRKEAYVKALGDGLIIRLDSFDVTLVPGKQVELSNGSRGSWAIYAPGIAGYAAAVVVQGVACDLKLKKWKSPEATEATYHCYAALRPAPNGSVVNSRFIDP